MSLVYRFIDQWVWDYGYMDECVSVYVQMNGYESMVVQMNGYESMMNGMGINKPMMRHSSKTRNLVCPKVISNACHPNPAINIITIIGTGDTTTNHRCHSDHLPSCNII